MIIISQIAKTQYRITMEDNVFKVKILVTHNPMKSVKIFSLEIFRLYSSSTFQLRILAHIAEAIVSYSNGVG